MFVTTKIDGMPQRMIANELAGAHRARERRRHAARRSANALALKRITGASLVRHAALRARAMRARAT